MFEQPHDRFRIKEAGVIRHHASQSIRVFDQRHNKVELYCPALDSYRLDLERRQAQILKGSVLEREYDLKEWRAAEVTFLLQFFDECSEGEVLMLVSAK